MMLRATAMLVLFMTVAPPAGAQPQQARENPSGNQLHEGGWLSPQLSGRSRVTSKGRVTAGSLLGLAGSLAVLYELFQCRVAGPDADRYDPPFNASFDFDSDVSECVLDGHPDPQAPMVWAEPDRDARILWSGAGVAVLGVLLATVWSEVDADDTVAFSVRLDGGVEMTKRINIW